MNSKTKTRILVVEDNEDLARNLVEIFAMENFLADAAFDAEAALEKCRGENFDIAVVDIKLPGMDGIDFVRGLWEISPGASCIFITGEANQESAIRAVGRPNVVSYEEKPLDMDRLLMLIREVIARKAAEKGLLESEQRFREVVEMCSDGILAADMLTRKFKYANRAICSMLGRTHDELLSMSVDDIHPESEYARIAEAFATMMKSGPFTVPEVACVRKDGTVFYADVGNTVIQMNGRDTVFGFFRDITEKLDATAR